MNEPLDPPELSKDALKAMERMDENIRRANAERARNPLGRVTRPYKGVEQIEFKDLCDDPCKIETDGVGCTDDKYEKAVWFCAHTLVDDPDSGDTSFEEHRVIGLNREGVEGLVARLQNWLAGGSFDPKGKP